MVKKLTNLSVIGTINYTKNLEVKLRDQRFRSSIVSTWKIENLKESDENASRTDR